MSRKKIETAKREEHQGGVKSALEVALEKASHLEDEPIKVEIESGPVSMTFEELKQKAGLAEEYLRQLQYKQAEFENYRKRTQREREELAKEMIPVGEALPILESLERALEAPGGEDSIREGVRLIRDQLWSLLEKKGVERVPGVGEAFDPNHHEAIAQQPHTEVPEGRVALEYQPGFRLGDRVIRAAKVVVSSGPPEEGENERR